MVVLVEILGEGIGDNFQDAKQKAHKMKEMLEKAYPEEKLKVRYDDESVGNTVGFSVVKEIYKK